MYSSFLFLEANSSLYTVKYLQLRLITQLKINWHTIIDRQIKK